MAERRVSLIPVANTRVRLVDHLNVRSPVLVSLITSCDLKFTDPREDSGPYYEGALLWDFEIVPAPAAAVVRPRPIVEDPAVYETLPQLDLESVLTCNCFFEGYRSCIVDMNPSADGERLDDVAELDEPLSDLLLMDDKEETSEPDDESDIDERETCEEAEENVEEDFVEYFPVVGSNWEERYQEGLKKCFELKVKRQTVEVRVEHEPDNISDCNALKFEVLYNGQWFIIGYCGVKKIPKLKRALIYLKVISLELSHLKRIWYPAVNDFLFAAGVNILKLGQWGKDDPNNRHNSPIDM